MCGDNAQIYHGSNSKSLVPSPEFPLLWEALHNHSSSPTCPPDSHGTGFCPMVHGCLSSPAFSSVFVRRA